MRQFYIYFKTKRTYRHCIHVVKNSSRRMPTMGKQSSNNRKEKKLDLITATINIRGENVQGETLPTHRKSAH